MSKQRNIENLFSENLGRILAGKELDLSALGDVEMRSSLEFARRISQLRPLPSAQYSSRLKATLLQKLDAQEARTKENGGWSWNILRQPVWQAVIAVFVVILVLSLVWRAGVFRPSISTPSPTMSTTATTVPSAPSATPAPTTAPAPSATTAAPSAKGVPGPLLTVGAWTGKSTYKSGEKIGINVLMENSSPQKLTLEKLPPILSIMKTDTETPVYTFAAGKETRTLAPGESVQFSYTWNGLDFKGIKVTGRCYLELEDLDYQGSAVPLHLGQPAYFDILPGSAGNSQAGDINYHETQTDNNISVTITRINISPAGIIVEAFITPPPDYVVTPGSGGYFAAKDYSASASYSFDSGWVKDAGESTVTYLRDGMEHTWYIPDTVPSGSKELFFHVTSIGGWQGSWQFHIPLE